MRISGKICYLNWDKKNKLRISPYTWAKVTGCLVDLVWPWYQQSHQGIISKLGFHPQNMPHLVFKPRDIIATKRFIVALLAETYLAADIQKSFEKKVIRVLFDIINSADQET